MSNKPYIIGPGETPPDPHLINDCLNYSGLATERELQFLKLPSDNQDFFSKVGNFLARILGSPPTTNSGGTQISANNYLPSGGSPQISGSKVQNSQFQLPATTHTAVSSQTSANLTPQNRGGISRSQISSSNPQPQPIQSISQKKTGVNTQTSANLTPQNRGKISRSQISSSNPQPRPIQPLSQTNASVNSQTSVNLTPQNRGKNPQPTAQSSTTVNNLNSQISTNVVKSRSKTAMTLEDAIGFAENPEPRCPLVLLLDVSGSMSRNNKIDNLNEGIKILKDELEKDDLTKLRVEVAIVSFGQEVNVVQDFVTVDEFKAPTLTTDGQTMMGTGINKALDMVNERKNVYKEQHIGYYRPWVFMITDGVPQGEEEEIIEEASQRINQMEDEKAVTFFAVGVEGANMEKLKGIVTKRTPLKLKGIDFREMFIWLSNSMKSKSHSQIGEQYSLSDPTGPQGWASE